ncbi:MAG TPA: hypothetical protein VMP01_25665, partial [Pirellulaceae bacterium]|nr:hypothetical protein [Pirellulaceae bacterium]
NESDAVGIVMRQRVGWSHFGLHSWDATMSSPESPYAPPTDASLQAPASVPRTGSRNPLKIILAIVGIALVVPCVCGGIFVVFAISIGAMARAEQVNVEPVVESYLQKMKDKDAAGAYALFSTFAKQRTAPLALEALLQEPNYAVFSGYQDAAVTNIRINVTPTRRLAVIQGTVTYEGGVSGVFNAVLEREEDKWLIQAINVTVPPSKFVSGQAK